MANVFLHCHRRLKNGKEHRYWSITEKVRVSRGRWGQRHLLYLGEINHSQKASWTKVIQVFDTQKAQTAELALSSAEPPFRITLRTMACKFGSRSFPCIVPVSGALVG